VNEYDLQYDGNKYVAIPTTNRIWNLLLVFTLNSENSVQIYHRASTIRKSIRNPDIRNTDDLDCTSTYE